MSPPPFEEKVIITQVGHEWMSNTRMAGQLK